MILGLFIIVFDYPQIKYFDYLQDETSQILENNKKEIYQKNSHRIFNWNNTFGVRNYIDFNFNSQEI